MGSNTVESAESPGQGGEPSRPGATALAAGTPRPEMSSHLTTTSDDVIEDDGLYDRIEREELVSDLMRLRWLSTIGAVAWVSFVVQDWVVANIAHYGRFGYFAAIRAIGGVFIVYVVVRLRVGKAPSRRELNAIDVGIFSIINISIALLCLDYEGIASRYATGIVITLVARSSVLAAHWRRGLVLLGTPLLFFPLTLFASAAFVPSVRAQFHDSVALVTFIQNVYVHFVSLAICVWGGHGNWTMRRQLFTSRSIGKYRLKRRIGRGGMGEVWVAYHSGLQRDVALKILRQDEDTSAVAVKRFEQEVAATTQLTHPNTVRVFDYGVTEDGIWYYAMELLDGVTLKDLVDKNGPLEQPRALRIAHRISRALAEAHQRGIVHRDIKPENIFIAHAGNEPDFVKVLDFGIAKMAASEQDYSLTRTGSFLGTPAYMSPEAAKGAETGCESDVYGVGALLYFMLTGSPPFTGRSPTEVLLAKLERVAPAMSAAPGIEVDGDVEAVVERCLAKVPADRYPDAGALAEALAELRRAR